MSQILTMANDSFSVIILAAGKGTRMKSPLPKVLHPVAGSPMIYRTVKSVAAAGAEEIRVVVGFGEELVRQVVEPLGAVCFRQLNQWGTGDAVKAARPESLSGPVLILNGDHPLITKEDITLIMSEFKKSNTELAVVTCEMQVPGTYGRIIRHQGQVRAIVEAKDSSHETLKIKEVNTGIYAVEGELLAELLPQIRSHNAQNEYYLTDIIALFVEQGGRVEGIKLNERVAQGVNTQMELAKASEIIFMNQIEKLMEAGVVVVDPKTTYIEEGVEIGEGTVIYPGTYIKGRTKIGKLCVIEPNCFINSCTVEDSVQIKAGCYMVQATVRTRSEIGPYAHLRPDTEIGQECKVGNFVEMKKVKFGDGSKASHLSYLGDAVIGKNVNVGCGTITCNYAVDRNKYVTRIDDDVFVGSDSQFVAPVQIGKGAVIASGSTITKNVPPGALAVARSKQIVKENYKPKTSSFKKDEE